MSISTGNAIAIGIITSIVGFTAGIEFGKQNQPLNITGNISHSAFKPDRLRISFNGIEVLAGNLDSNGSGNFVGEYDKKPVSAICSTNETTACIIDFNDRKQTIAFNKKAEE